jgi:hypothetical protein
VARPTGEPTTESIEDNQETAVGLNTNSWVFKCALTCTHSIVGWGFSLPYHGTSIASGQFHFIVAYARGRKFLLPFPLQHREYNTPLVIDSTTWCGDLNLTHANSWSRDVLQISTELVVTTTLTAYCHCIEKSMRIISNCAKHTIAILSPFVSLAHHTIVQRQGAAFYLV